MAIEDNLNAAPTPESTGTPPPLTKNQEKNEAKRKAKMEKFLAKKAAQEAKGAEATGNAKPKEKKTKSVPKPKDTFVNTTPEGEKKDMTLEMAGSYDPVAVESAWYSWWEKQGYFQPITDNGEISAKGSFVITAPPPNVTGKLHIGHAMGISIQDALVRWNRMRGVTTLFVPGTDHAGISTQAVVENQVWKQFGKTRHDYGRGPFVDMVWDWKHKYGDIIMKQMRRMGTSYDWTRERFTMDDMMTRATKETFVRLFDDGIIYRSNRLVNWCHRLNTSLSNLEVEKVEIPGRTMMSVPGYPSEEKFEFGVLVHFAYEIEGSSERIVVATTRIETMLGDTAIAVHPDDARYKHLHGKFARHPFVDRRIPIITDSEAVDMEYGTGAVKMTPAHDPNDYEVGKRHNLEFINLLNDDGTYNQNAGPYCGMLRFHIRKQIIEDIKAKGLYVDTTSNPMEVPVCTKSGDIIEPLMKPQWWVNIRPLAEPALEAVRDGRLEITPMAAEKDWFHKLGKFQDWCLSRQLWWGHQIPAYFVRVAGQECDSGDINYWVVGRDDAEARKRAEEKFPGVAFELEQDPDVLDTWFSSGLWPFALMGWPDNTDDFEKYYPTSLLETGNDILFFWVARMVMLGMHLTGKVPFAKVFCHAMIRDANGRKMSKSLGNVIDPIDVIQGISLDDLHAKLESGNLDPREVSKAKEGQVKDFPEGIPECGTDALRFALCAYPLASSDIKLDIQRVDGYRKFCNKLWNATRFALMKLGDDFVPQAEAQLTGRESLAELWILHRLNVAIRDVNAALADMNFMVATTAIYGFWLNELCDIFIEYIKPVTAPGANPEACSSAQQTLYTCLDQGLRMLHPLMPFVTEELWQRLPRRASENEPSISIAAYPEPRSDYENAKAESDFKFVMDIATAGRSLAAAYNIVAKSEFYISNSSDASYALTSSLSEGIVTMISGCQSVTVLRSGEAIPAGCVVSSVGDEVAIHLLVRGKVDIGQEISKIEDKISKVEQLKDGAVKRTQVPKYETVVPQSVREANASKISNYDAEIEVLQNSIKEFLVLKDGE
ncbi:valine--tRNA ligase [Coemansia sp. RSA 451]|nr:valine--tRNA ligase [Coemansia sp. RSA 564]KAJ2185588.1 valine--tRNA ligase [Coemansia sp. RSA 532]KAJ2274059.1 valine--tRNA ligase [Coemansia sp. RSA 451]